MNINIIYEYILSYYNYLTYFFRFHFENFDQMRTIKTKVQEDEELLFSCDSEVESPSTTFKID